jgi:MoxR-like ATPase
MNTVVATFEQSVQREIARVIVGAEDVIRALCIALIARGHVLVQGPPGLGKTLLA